MTGRATASRPALELLGVYIYTRGVAHRVQVHRTAPQSWEILDAPETGEPRVIEELTGELERRDTAAAVARDYLTQVQRRPSAR